MANLKHIGRMTKSKERVLVAFRTLPGESNQALVVPVSSLTSEQHDSIMKLVETTQAQSAFEFGEIMFKNTFSDGKKMLQILSAKGVMQKVATDEVTMTPNTKESIQLSELNKLIAEQKNMAIDDLYTLVSGAPTSGTTVEEAASVSETPAPKSEPVTESLRAQAPENGVLSDADIAKSYRSQADAMYKEAARLRREADELDPPKKKTTTKKAEASA